MANHTFVRRLLMDMAKDNDHSFEKLFNRRLDLLERGDPSILYHLYPFLTDPDLSLEDKIDKPDFDVPIPFSMAWNGFSVEYCIDWTRYEPFKTFGSEFLDIRDAWKFGLTKRHLMMISMQNLQKIRPVIEFHRDVRIYTISADIDAEPSYACSFLMRNDIWQNLSKMSHSQMAVIPLYRTFLIAYFGDAAPNNSELKNVIQHYDTSQVFSKKILLWNGKCFQKT